jgi:hypothetical protein
MNRAIYVLIALVVTVSLGIVAVPMAGEVGADLGGPDAYGYSFIDSDEATGPVYDWIDITGMGSTGPTSDDSYVQVLMGFDFNFYGNTYDEVVISSNGYLTFNYTGFDGADWTNDCIPDTEKPDLFIAPFWDDLDPQASGVIYYETLGTAPDREFVVEYHGISHCCANDTGVTFEVILYEGCDNILFQYQDVVFDYPHDYADWGVSATVGLENSDGTDGLQYSCDEASLHSDLAIMFSTGPKEEEGYPIVGVGGEAYPINKLTILAPVIAVLAGIAGASMVLRRRRAQS